MAGARDLFHIRGAGRVRIKGFPVVSKKEPKCIDACGRSDRDIHCTQNAGDDARDPRPGFSILQSVIRNEVRGNKRKIYQKNDREKECKKSSGKIIIGRPAKGEKKDKKTEDE